MRQRRTVGALVLITGLSTVLTGVAAAAPAGGSPANSVQGSGVTGYPTALGPDHARLTVRARSTDDVGSHPAGLVTAKAGPVAPFRVSGTVTCLRIVGHRAAVKYRFDQASGSAAPLRGGGVEIFVEDNGAPHGKAPVDRAAFNPPEPVGVFAASADRCDDPTVANFQPLTSGDYTVRS